MITGQGKLKWEIQHRVEIIGGNHPKLRWDGFWELRFTSGQTAGLYVWEIYDNPMILLLCVKISE